VQGTLVSFPVREIFLPATADVLLQLHGDELLQGRIIDYSDGGEHGRTYAIVRVEGLPQPVIVPVENLRNDCE
jgi:hypothetical protein